MGIIRELRRRRVFRTAGIYIVAAWALLQVCDLVFRTFGVAAGRSVTSGQRQ